MTGRLAILAGTGVLPGELLRAVPDAVMASFVTDHRLEKLGEVFEGLRTQGVSQVVMAGSIAPPKFDPEALDPLMQIEAPALLAALAQGDDAALRAVIDLTERQGFEVPGAHEVVPGLTLPAGAASEAVPDNRSMQDIIRARAILTALGLQDVGQACVVAGGRCLGIETAQGTAAMLDFVSRTEPAKRPKVRGVLVKAPKADQDLRVDMPAIGPDTITQANRAGLAGVAITAGQNLVLDRAGVDAALHETGLFLWADAP